MRRVFSSLIVLVFLLSGCAVRETTGRAGGVAGSEGDLTERYVRQIVHSLGESFGGKDVGAFMRHVSDGFYGGRALLEQKLRRTFADAEDISISIEVEEVQVGDMKVKSVVTWSSERRVSGKTEPVRTSGKTILEFHKTDRISLVNLRGDSLFGVPGL